MDLVAGALVVGSTSSAREAAQQVLLADTATPLAQSVARRVLDGGTSPLSVTPAATMEERDTWEQIRLLKAQIVSDPRNSIAWTEMARHYAIDGKRPQAERAMGIALALAPNHRYVLRSASRLAIHVGDVERAHRIVVDSPATRTDPWLMATEMATSEVAHRRPRLTKDGRRLLTTGSYSLRATSELAGAIGTLELRSGSDRRAKRFFRAALTEPNENMVAHGEWASRQVNGLVIPDVQLESSWEARAYRYGEGGHWAEALEAAWGWLADQPFSSGPAELGSYQACLGRDFEAGVAIARAGRRANPGEFILTNNLAFCLIQLGQIAEAADLLANIDVVSLPERERATFLATIGLLCFRAGKPEEGRTLYRQSISMERNSRDSAIALIMLAVEEFRLSSPYARDLLSEALDAGGAAERGNRDISLWLSYLPDPSKLP